MSATACGRYVSTAAARPWPFIGRCLRFIADAGPATLARAARWTVPTLLLWGEDDRIVNPAGSRAFAAAAPPAVVHAQGFAGLYHEIFNERDAAPVFAQLESWLEQRCPVRRAQPVAA